MSKIIITATRGGEMQFLYNDAMTGLMKHGDATIERASFVEPTADNKWTADMKPSHGPVLGPFDTRAEALAAEVRWINENVLTQKEN